MKPEPVTEELLHELLKMPTLDDAFGLCENVDFDLAAYLNRLLQEKQLRKSKVIRESGLNETFAYQIFSGSRGASRDKILQLAFAMRLELLEVQRLLEHAGANRLYCKNRRDMIIIFCIKNSQTLAYVDEQLYCHGEKTITNYDAR